MINIHRDCLPSAKFSIISTFSITYESARCKKIIYFKIFVRFFGFPDTIIMKGNRNRRSHANGGTKGAVRCSKNYSKPFRNISIPADSLQNEKRGIT
ncbi:hypothetical protein OBV_31270 [Oscillibacter valericigenes Sjm18-20]|nr:hypothetical protein OBV_31270 [Oscillibacter valericigenes Sjm18-20]